MKTRRLVPMMVSLALVFGLQACNFPGMVAPTPFPFQTPDLTLTAIFSPIAPTSTLPPLVQTATALPTQAVTDTPAPTQTPLIPPTTNTIAPTQTSIVPPATNTPAPTIPPPKNTATPTRAKTATPTLPPVTPTARPNEQLVARRLDTPPTIDGNLSEWKLNRVANDVVYGADRVFSENDLSARFSIGWDQNYLYLAASVKDQKYVQNATGENLYKGDSLEILLDAKLTADFYDTELSADDYQLGISPGSPEPGQNMEAYLWYPRRDRGSVSNVVIAAVATAVGYDVELAIPWNLFDIRPREGQHYGFAFSISDNDKAGSLLQESMVSNVATRRLTDPTTWGDLRLARP